MKLSLLILFIIPWALFTHNSQAHILAHSWSGESVYDPGPLFGFNLNDESIFEFTLMPGSPSIQFNFNTGVLSNQGTVTTSPNTQITTISGDIRPLVLDGVAYQTQLGETISGFPTASWTTGGVWNKQTSRNGFMGIRTNPSADGETWFYGYIDIGQFEDPLPSDGTMLRLNLYGWHDVANASGWLYATAPPIPEPSTSILGLLTVAGLTIIRRR